jgi:hypothetical protein
VGENPPEGAILDYYLPAPASGLVTLRITDAAGSLVREYSSVALPQDTTMANVPSYWLAPPVVLPTTQGMHRIAWDLRYPDPPTLNYGYFGTALDYREYTLTWHAIPGKTPRSTLVGPMVLPGNYTVTLTVDGRSYTQRLEVVQDPRITVPAAALEAQFHLEQRIVAGIAATYYAMTYIDQLHAALTGPSSAQPPQSASDAQQLDKATMALTSGPQSLGIAHRDLTRRLNDQLISDAEPTPSVVAGVDGPCHAIDAALDELRTLQATKIPGVNATRGRAALAALPVWSPPAAPACGA